MNETKLTRQQQRIIEYINTFGSITSLQAYNDLGIVQLPTRIWELKRLGYKIAKKHITVRNRFKEKSSIVSYSFVKESEQ